MSDSALQAMRKALSDSPPHTMDGLGLKPSAVLLLLYPKNGEYCILFNKRTQEVEFNKGEICFPGGARDPDDPDLIATALRETHEEMGIRPEDVTILGELDGTSTRAGFGIHPYVAVIPCPYQFTPSPMEVAEVLEVPLSTLLDSRNVREEFRMTPDGRRERAQTYAYGRHLIFGATARILKQFLILVELTGLHKEANRS